MHRRWQQTGWRRRLTQAPQRQTQRTRLQSWQRTAELAAELVCLEAFGIPHGGLLLGDFGATTTSPMGGATPTTSRRRRKSGGAGTGVGGNAKTTVAKFDPAAVYGAVPVGVKAASW